MASQPTPPPEPAPAAEAPAVRYLGDGTEYLAGVPARDLTAAEWEALDAATRAAVATVQGAAGPLYAAPAEPAAAPKAKAAPPPAAAPPTGGA